MNNILFIITFAVLVSGCSQPTSEKSIQPEQVAAVSGWHVNFIDEFDTFNPENWQDQPIWVNNEHHCYVRDNEFGTREVSNGSIKLKVIDIGEKRSCDNFNKHGEQHPDTQYVAGRIASKNLKEFVKGKWTARLKVENSGQSGMFPAWWLLGARNNEPPVKEPDENICWPMVGSGEIDIFEHHGDGGPDHYAARAIKSNGECDGGDWQSLMLVQAAQLNEFQEYSVEWVGDDVIFRLNEMEVYRLPNEAAKLSEPFFAILNFAKINDSPMTQNWTMEVDWVKHEVWK